MRLASAGAALASVMLFTLPFAHSVALRLLGLFGALACVLLAWRSLEVPRIALLPLLGSWAALGAISLTWAVDLEYSASEFKSEVLYSALTYLVFFALASPERLELFRRVILVATAASFASALHWAIWPGESSLGRFYHGSGMYSTYLAMVFPFVLVWALDGTQSARSRAVHFLLLAGIVAGAAMSQNRAVWLSFALQAILVIVLHPAPPLGRWGTRARALAALAVLAAAAGAFYGTSLSRGTPLSVAAALETDGRTALWRFALERIAEQPFTGAGFGRGAQRREIREATGSYFEHAHNTVLNYGLGMGIWGIAMIVALFGVVLARYLQAWRSAHAQLKPYALAAIAFLLGLAIKLMTDDFFYRQTTLFFWAVAGMLVGAHERLRRTEAPRRPPSPA